jgi:hypothetical protein
MFPALLTKPANQRYSLGLPRCTPHTPSMRDRLMSLPIWALFLVTGLPWLPVLLVIGLVEDADFARAFVPAAVFSVVMGLLVTLALKYRWRAEGRAVGDVGDEVRRAAIGASVKGPVPTDPEVRAVALRLAEHRLEQIRRTRVWILVSTALVVVGNVISAIYSPWRLLFLAIYLPSMLIGWFVVPKQVRARIALLSEPQEPVRRTQ